MGRNESGLGRIRRIRVDSIQPSPENEQLYRPVESDPELDNLVESIREHGVQEPLLVTTDRFVLSGHRRLAAARRAGLRTVPCRFAAIPRINGNGHLHPEFMTLLREANRQRVKTFAETVREAVIDADPDAAYQALVDHREEAARVELDTIPLRGRSRRAEISAAKLPFLNAIQSILEAQRKFWPLSDRRIHYALLNDPPLIHASKPGSTYRNENRSYKALCELLTRARLDGSIPMTAIADSTRPQTNWSVYQSPGPYLDESLATFANGYWRDLMQSQPNHVEIVGEKNTIESIIRPVAARYCIPYTIGRGFCSLRPRFDIAERFEASGKDRLILLILSDFDPDGEEIAHSFARSLRDDFDVGNVEAVKVALTADQVNDMDLPAGGKAKKGSTNYRRFSERYGDEVWELEAIDPETLQTILTEAVDAVIDAEAFNQELDQEPRDAAELAGVRAIVLESLNGYRGGGEQ